MLWRPATLVAFLRGDVQRMPATASWLYRQLVVGFTFGSVALVWTSFVLSYRCANYVVES